MFENESWDLDVLILETPCAIQKQWLSGFDQFENQSTLMAAFSGRN